MGDFVTEAFTLLAIALVLIALRTYARSTSAGIHNFQIDDYLMLLAGVSQPSLLRADLESLESVLTWCLPGRVCVGDGSGVFGWSQVPRAGQQ